MTGFASVASCNKSADANLLLFLCQRQHILLKLYSPILSICDLGTMPLPLLCRIICYNFRFTWLKPPIVTILSIIVDRSITNILVVHHEAASVFCIITSNAPFTNIQLVGLLQISCTLEQFVVSLKSQKLWQRLTLKPGNSGEIVMEVRLIETTDTMWCLVWWGWARQ